MAGRTHTFEPGDRVVATDDFRTNPDFHFCSGVVTHLEQSAGTEAVHVLLDIHPYCRYGGESGTTRWTHPASRLRHEEEEEEEP